MTVGQVALAVLSLVVVGLALTTVRPVDSPTFMFSGVPFPTSNGVDIKSKTTIEQTVYWSVANADHSVAATVVAVIPHLSNDVIAQLPSESFAFLKGSMKSFSAFSEYPSTRFEDGQSEATFVTNLIGKGVAVVAVADPNTALPAGASFTSRRTLEDAYEDMAPIHGTPTVFFVQYPSAPVDGDLAAHFAAVDASLGKLIASLSESTSASFLAVVMADSSVPAPVVAEFDRPAVAVPTQARVHLSTVVPRDLAAEVAAGITVTYVFFSPAVWQGLMIAAISLILFYIGIACMYCIQNQEKYEEPPKN